MLRLLRSERSDVRIASLPSWLRPTPAKIGSLESHTHMCLAWAPGFAKEIHRSPLQTTLTSPSGGVFREPAFSVGPPEGNALPWSERAEKVPNLHARGQWLAAKGGWGRGKEEGGGGGGGGI
uniref:Uncharacterized protein n=1 Tax=Knipowitschia caucasica TaxID=637954 RepID=A0AAV2J0R7_KNICA